MGFKNTTVEFDVQEREAGVSKWSGSALIQYAITNIAAFYAVPMQLVTLAGFCSLIGALILGVQTLANYWAGRAVEGFTTVILLILLTGSIIMMSLGIIGYYISKIYDEVKGRPRYFISRTVKNRAQNIP